MTDRGYVPSDSVETSVLGDGRRRSERGATATTTATMSSTCGSISEISGRKDSKVPPHRTVRLRPRVYEVPTLGHLCVQTLAENADSIVDLRGVGEDSARRLLREIMNRRRLTYPLAKVFMEAGDEELSSALASLNLWDAIPVGKHGRHGRHL